MSADSQGKLLVLYKSREELNRDWQQIAADFEAAWAGLTRDLAMLKVVNDAMTPEMSERAQAVAEKRLRKVGLGDLVGPRRTRESDIIAKLAADEGLKKDAARIDAAPGGVGLRVMQKMAEVLARHNERVAEHNRLTKRSERFQRRFA